MHGHMLAHLIHDALEARCSERFAALIGRKFGVRNVERELDEIARQLGGQHRDTLDVT